MKEQKEETEKLHSHKMKKQLDEVQLRLALVEEASSKARRLVMEEKRQHQELETECAWKSSKCTCRICRSQE